jgi:hypothetical protein
VRRSSIREPTQRAELELGVMNVGTRTAQAATLQLLIPSTFNNQAMFGDTSYPRWFRAPEVEGYSRWEVDIDRNFFVDVPVTRAAHVAFFYPTDVGDPFEKMQWRIAFGDGVVPGRGQWSPLTTREAMQGSG